MADNVVKVKVVGDVSDLEHALGNVKRRINETFFNPSAFSLNSISPWKIGADLIVGFAKGIWEGFSRANEKMAALGKQTISLAKSLNATNGEAMRLESAARAAGVGAQEYAEAVERIKSGESTLEREAEQWEHVADSAKLANERARGFAGLFQAYQERIKTADEEESLAAKWGAEVRKSFGAGGEKAGALLYSEVDKGRRTPFLREDVLAAMGTSKEALEEAQRMANASGGTWGLFAGTQIKQTLDNADKILEIVNREIEDRLKQEQKRAEAEKSRLEEERKRTDAEAAKQKAEVERIIEADRKAEAARKAREQAEIAAENDQAKRDEEALADRVAKAYTGLLDVVGGEAGRLVQEAFGLDSATMGRLLELGLRRAATPEAELQEMMARERAEQDARKREQAEAEAERTRLTEREADLQKRIRETEGELSASWMTSAGGSLIGGGSFALAMAERMRAIDREEKQQEMVEELRGVREELRKIVRNTNE